MNPPLLGTFSDVVANSLLGETRAASDPAPNTVRQFYRLVVSPEAP
jgi:hypothetical protein